MLPSDIMNGSNTIEPRLIALLNDAPHDLFTSSPSLELPPLHDPNILKVSGRPLLLEPDASSKRNGKLARKAQLETSHILPPLDDEKNAYKDDRKRKAGNNSRDRALGRSSPQSLRKILDNDTETLPVKKRQMVEPNKDERQLPQPPKKQKTAKQVVPPIIIGLFEPPPQATLFPPIASSSFHDSHGRNSLNTVPLKAKLVRVLPKSDPSSNGKPNPSSASVPKRNAIKTRKKWSDEETNNLLLGVHKHGVGCWSDILGDPAFYFNERSAADLKDRFRTCCPAELRGKAQPEGPSKRAKQTKTKSSLMSENILINDEMNDASGNVTSSRTKSRTHRKKIEDLAQLGIEGPFRKSSRRERRAFSEEEDRAILEGYSVYGPSWAKIQRDPQLNLQSRQPTDLRDRFRNKYPQKFGEDKLVKKASFEKPKEKETSSSNFDMGNRSFEAPTKEYAPFHQSSREALSIKDITTDTFSSFVDNPSMDSTDNLPFSQSFDWNQGIAAPFSNGIGEMDISRLLLYETWDMPSSSGKEKESGTSNAETMHNLPSFLNMLNDPIDDMNDGPFE